MIRLNRNRKVIIVSGEYDDVNINDDEKNAIEAIEYVNDINDDGFKSYNSNSNISAPKFDTFKKRTFK